MKNKIKKLIIYFIILMFFIFCIKDIFLQKVIETNADDEILFQTEYKEFDYGDYKTIKLLHTSNNEIEELPLDIYLYGVVSSEMPASFEIEALRAQAIVARTYTIYKIMMGSKHQELNADICDSSLCCQAWISKENRLARWEEDKRKEYWNKIEEAVNSTIGKVILYNGQPINAFFHSNSGGSTEVSENVWGGKYDYLQSVETSGEDAYTSYASEIVISKDDLIVKMREKYSNFEIDFSKNDCIKILENTESGRVKKIKIGNLETSGVEARTIFGLKSAKFTIEIDENNVKFSVLGYGHGVGLSQCGSDSLAKKGYNYNQIIKHYYKDIEISE